MTVGSGVIAGVSVSHRTADLDAIESAGRVDRDDVVRSLLTTPGVTEAFALRTCNRVEAYVVADAPETGRAALDRLFGERAVDATTTLDVPVDARRELSHEESLRHLMRVACGLESLVVGEDQILGQLRDAYLDARSLGSVGPVLEDALMKAVHVGERARTETAINEGAVSLGSAAARVAGEELDLSRATALVVGAGEMGSLAARAFAKRADRLLVANRTVDRAEYVARTLDVEAGAVGLKALPAAVAEADVVVTATGADRHVLDGDVLRGAGETLVIDIAQPRDVDPAVDALSTVTVYDLDALQSVTDETTEQREAAAREVEAMIDREFDNLLSQYKRKRADEVIAAMYEGAEGMKHREVKRARSRLEASDGPDLTEEQYDILDSLADALVGQLLAAPTKSLRDAAEKDDWSTINTAIQLFDPHNDRPVGGEDGRPAIPEGVTVDDIPEPVREGMPPAVLEQLSDD
ncbi:glutamyl-tRNA reductase [Halomarina ordinaria]|uniref:Glutamyl-tRNA reductase n=1 Tax=Halomarina ordinaria TaxID=3033939 RepID=A0ABD5U8G1_9EURY|nr:glutamyl-tRNA reductase [Halomarina sp. PSRA2]